jgi:hypothetical protein
MGRQQLPIWRDANRLLVEVETKECLSFILSGNLPAVFAVN